MVIHKKVISQADNTSIKRVHPFGGLTNETLLLIKNL